jgi:hypothetical protein
MALEKEIETIYGVSATYWKIAATNINWHEKIASIEVWGYVDANASAKHKGILKCITYRFEDSDFTFTMTSNIVAECYEKIKVMEEWQNANNV